MVNILCWRDVEQLKESTRNHFDLRIHLNLTDNKYKDQDNYAKIFMKLDHFIYFIYLFFLQVNSISINIPESAQSNSTHNSNNVSTSFQSSQKINTNFRETSSSNRTNTVNSSATIHAVQIKKFQLSPENTILTNNDNISKMNNSITKNNNSSFDQILLKTHKLNS